MITNITIKWMTTFPDIHKVIGTEDLKGESDRSKLIQKLWQSLEWRRGVVAL